MQELKERLTKEYPYRTELHAHALPVSRCSQFQPEELVKAYAGIGVDSLVLTNHFTASQIVEKPKEETLAEYAACYREAAEWGNKYGLQVIFAMEIRFAQNSNDYLLYGVTEEDLPALYQMVTEGKDIKEFYRAFHREGVLILQAHPFRNGMEEVDGAYLDGIEAFNMHPGHNSRVALAAARANREGCVLSGGTDFHHPGHQGACLMRTRTLMKTPADIVAALRSRDFLLDLGGSLILP